MIRGKKGIGCINKLSSYKEHLSYIWMGLLTLDDLKKKNSLLKNKVALKVNMLFFPNVLKFVIYSIAFGTIHCLLLSLISVNKGYFHREINYRDLHKTFFLPKPNIILVPSFSTEDILSKYLIFSGFLFVEHELFKTMLNI